MKKSAHGFTLIELMVVVAIIAVLSVIGITIFGNVQSRARDARRKADIDSISKAWETHVNTAANQFCANSEAGAYCQLNASWFASGTIPTDPDPTKSYTYQSGGASDTVGPRGSYKVCATLEDGTQYCMASQQ